MSDDITFCFNNHCRNRKCERNPANIRVPYKPHSFAFFKDCEYWNLPNDDFHREQCGKGVKPKAGYHTPME